MSKKEKERLKSPPKEIDDEREVDNKKREKSKKRKHKYTECDFEETVEVSLKCPIEFKQYMTQKLRFVFDTCEEL